MVRGQPWGGSYCDGKVSGGAKYSSSCDHVNEDEERRVDTKTKKRIELIF